MSFDCWSTPTLTQLRSEEVAFAGTLKKALNEDTKEVFLWVWVQAVTSTMTTMRWCWRVTWSTWKVAFCLGFRIGTGFSSTKPCKWNTTPSCCGCDKPLVRKLCVGWWDLSHVRCGRWYGSVSSFGGDHQGHPDSNNHFSQRLFSFKLTWWFILCFESTLFVTFLLLLFIVLLFEADHQWFDLVLLWHLFFFFLWREEPFGKTACLQSVKSLGQGAKQREGERERERERGGGGRERMRGEGERQK